MSRCGAECLDRENHVADGAIAVPARTNSIERRRNNAQQPCGARYANGKECPPPDVVTVAGAARSLYLSQGFQIYALEDEAMNQGGEYYDVEHMVLRLR